jgi:hypothetical protein
VTDRPQAVVSWHPKGHPDRYQSSSGYRSVVRMPIEIVLVAVDDSYGGELTQGDARCRASE